MHLLSTCESLMLLVWKDLLLFLSLPLFLCHRYCIDHNNVSGDTPFHGHSSETELHKPFTTRSPWWMTGPQAKAPGPDRSTFLWDKYHQTGHVPIPFCFKWEYVCDKKSETKNFHRPLTYIDLQQNGKIRGFLLMSALCWNIFLCSLRGPGDLGWLICTRRWFIV